MKRREFLLAAAAAPFALPHLATAATARHGLVLVTADLASHIVVVDAATGRVRRRIATREAPRAIERVGRSARSWRTPRRASSASSTATTGACTKVLSGFQHPRYVAVHPRQEFAYVTDSEAGEVVVIDLRRKTVVRRLDVGGAGAPRLHLGQRHAALDGARLDRVAPRGARHEHARPAELLRRVTPPFLAHDVAIASNYGSVWVTSGDRGRIAIYRLNGAKLIGQIAAAAAPQHVAFVAGRAFVASGDDGSVRVHDGASGRLQRTTAVPVGSYNVTAGGGSHRDAVAGARHDRDPRPRRPAAARAPRRRLVARRLLDQRLASRNTAGSRAATASRLGRHGLRDRDLPDRRDDRPSPPRTAGRGARLPARCSSPSTRTSRPSRATP